MNTYIKAIVYLILKMSDFIHCEISSNYFMGKFIRHAKNQPSSSFICKCHDISQNTSPSVLCFNMFSPCKRIIMFRFFKFNMIFTFP